MAANGSGMMPCALIPAGCLELLHWPLAHDADRKFLGSADLRKWLLSKTRRKTMQKAARGLADLIADQALVGVKHAGSDGGLESELLAACTSKCLSQQCIAIRVTCSARSAGGSSAPT